MSFRLRVTKVEWGIVVGAVFGYIIPFILISVGVGPSLPQWAWVLIACAAGGTGFRTAYNFHQRGVKQERQANKLDRTIAEDRVRDILELVISATLDNRSARANVMLIDENKGRLYIAYHRGMAGSSDLTLRWPKLVGCCGHAWGRSKEMYADLASLSASEFEQTWKMDAEHRARTRDLGSVASVPIRDPNNSDIIIGVMNCDSKQDIHVSGLSDDNFFAQFRKYSRTVAGFLRLGHVA